MIPAITLGKAEEEAYYRVITPVYAGTPLSGTGAARQGARLTKVGFRRDMDTLLRPGLPAFDVDQAASSVRETYFRHLP